ncbi:uncharacterized protein LOC108471650 [Gossypium arboreum]|uniref:uncharacterized protein LOC108471650 n=1 Tax=Gossypium arboreum TaxID=29729 RepID=UPI00081948D8|nr:uncharacterized protein LOC108471650 [Gossypium arboreum]
MPSDIEQEEANEVDSNLPNTDTVKKDGAKEFWGRSEDDPAKDEYWLKTIQQVFNEIVCPLEDYLKCVVSLLREEAYNLWATITVVVPKNDVHWEFFNSEFMKKYISKRYLDKKKKEFLELNQGNKSVPKYEREFTYLSKYAREIVSTEEEMCTHFEDRLNDEIKMMIGCGIVRSSLEDGGNF